LEKFSRTTALTQLSKVSSSAKKVSWRNDLAQDDWSINPYREPTIRHLLPRSAIPNSIEYDASRLCEYGSPSVSAQAGGDKKKLEI
jgi:hypothetical protein